MRPEPFPFNFELFNAEFYPQAAAVPKSQEGCILSALRRGERLTPMDALGRFGCFRLGARIHALRCNGYPIDTRMIKVDGKRIAEYSLPMLHI